MNPKPRHIKSALKERLAQGHIADGVWPNVDPQGPMVHPYFEVEFIAENRDGAAVKGGSVRATGRMAVEVVTEGGTGEDLANDLADAISDLFLQALQLPMSSGTITIEQPADIRGGFRDGADWRVPVIIRYAASNT